MRVDPGRARDRAWRISVGIDREDISVRQRKHHFSIADEPGFVFPMPVVVLDDCGGDGLRLTECVDIERQWKEIEYLERRKRVLQVKQRTGEGRGGAVAAMECCRINFAAIRRHGESARSVREKGQDGEGFPA